MEPKNYAIQVLSKQLKGTIYFEYLTKLILEVSQNEDIGCSIGLEDDKNLFLWNIVFEGPSETLYEVI